MRHSAIRLSDSYRIPASYRAQLAKADHLFGHAQPAPDQLGGYFDFTDWRGQVVGPANFIGRWTLLYFGYGRCQGTCRDVAPMIVDAARTLRTRGLAAKAAFVDIEAPALSMTRRTSGGSDHDVHGTNWPKRMALAQLALDHGRDLELLSGSRYQLNQATAAFHVLREHVPPRASEEGLSINHSSMIYLIGPDTLVAGYGYHDIGAETMIALVEKLSKAERNPVDITAVRQRFVNGACGLS